MTTSRTGTATWKRVREQAIRRAKRQGLTNCRHCGVLLDYDVSKQPSSAEVDHLTPHSAGGQDHLNNVEVICRLCNQSKGNRQSPKQRQAPSTIKTSREW